MAFAPHSHFHQQSRSDNLLGLKVLHNIEDDLNISPVDVIAIHGLYRDHDATWCEELDDNSQRNWLVQNLPTAAHISNGRIMAYQYSADLSVHNLLSELTLHRAAISLLEAVAKKRGDENNGPIIFLCHNIGGVLVLFGTPDTSSQWEDVVFNIALATAKPSQRKSAVGVVLETGTEALYSTSLLFDSLNGQYQVVSSIEDSATSFIGIVVQLPASPITSSLKRDIFRCPGIDHNSLCKSPPRHFVHTLGDNIWKILSNEEENLLPFLEFRQTLAATSSTPILVPYNAPEPIPGTLDWASEVLRNSAGLITIYGTPGAGKSVLASWLARQRLKQVEAVTLWYYFSASDCRRRTYHQFLHSCLLQLHYHYKSRGLFESSYIRKLSGLFSWDKLPSAAEFHRLLQAIIWKMGDTTIYFVVDAVDECDASVTQLLYDLGRLTKSNLNCRIILTSRAEERIISVLAQFSDKVIHLDKIMEKERRLYLAKQVENAAFADDKGLLLTLGTTMLRVKLLVELLALIRPDDRHLLDLSTLESYDDIYAQIIKHIMAPGSWLQEALFCVAFAERPLSLDELSIALGKHPSATNTTQLPPEAWEMLPQRILADYSSTTLKLVIRIEDSTVYLIHDTLREFIRSQLQPLVRSTISTHPSSAPPPGSLLLLKCWQYLKEYSLENGEASNFESAHAALATTTRLRPFSGLMPYIIQCWCLHLNRMSTNEDHISQVFWLL
ncbi:hypothetical protein GGS24DRAFT_506161 [Hypoxylon argillaceum]|nr:hypothetical protein GGS24DRAFT_506161 [Hypoxylon argillaceum]